MKHALDASRRSSTGKAVLARQRFVRATPRLAFSAAALSLALAISPAPAHAARILVVQAAQTPRLVKALDALRARSSMPVDTIPLNDVDANAWDTLLASGERPAAVVALGPRASDHLMKQAGPLPIVHCLAGPDALRAGLPSLPSEVPADQQAAWLKRLLPRARTVGIAFNPGVNARRAEATAAALGAAGYNTWMTPVATPAALPAALDQLAARADVLFALPDAVVYAREAARGILLHSFRKRIPLIGPNEAWVQMGALYTVDWDYEEVGAVCAQLVARELQSAKAKGAPPAPPRARVSVNLRTAAQLGVQWDEALLRNVDHRHE